MQLDVLRVGGVLPEGHVLGREVHVYGRWLGPRESAAGAPPPWQRRDLTQQLLQFGCFIWCDLGVVGAGEGEEAGPGKGARDTGSIYLTPYTTCGGTIQVRCGLLGQYM